MQGYVDRGEVAGVVTLIARRGKVVHFESVGYRDAGRKIPMTGDTIFRIASMTKPIASVAAMMLYEEGRFQLSDPVSKWLPEFRQMKVVELPRQDQLNDMAYRTRDAKGPITIRQVLTHTAGLANANTGITRPEYLKLAPGTVPNDTLGTYIARLARLPLNFDPGERWEYGPGTDVVGRLVEVISGQTLQQFFVERIFAPLRMTDTHFHLPENKLSRFAILYKPNAQQKIELSEPAVNFARLPETFYSANGGLRSTAADYVRFHQMMLNGGELDGVRLLGRKTVELMTVNHSGDRFLRPGQGFGLGYSVVEDVGENGMPNSVGTYSWGGAFCTIFFVDPVEEMIGIMMTQLAPHTHLNIRQDFQVLAYQAITDTKRTRVATN
jgi:CubicO group peptidase (beta-lactamase class C family)